MRDEPTVEVCAEGVTSAHDDVRGRKILDEVEDAGLPNRSKEDSGGEEDEQ